MEGLDLSLHVVFVVLQLLHRVCGRDSGKEAELKTTPTCISGHSGLALTLQVADDEVVVQLERPVLLHLVLQLKDGLLHVAHLRLLLLQLQPLLLQLLLLLLQLLLRPLLEAPEVNVQLRQGDRGRGGVQRGRREEEEDVEEEQK